MTRFLAYNRRFLVLTAVLALMAGMLLAQAGLVAASHFPCSGESSYVDAGAYYIVHGTKGIDTINCSASGKAVEIRGNAGADTLTGSDFADWLYGGWGGDTLNGNGGTDTCLGGQNTDVNGDSCNTYDGGPGG